MTYALSQPVDRGGLWLPESLARKVAEPARADTVAWPMPTRSAMGVQSLPWDSRRALQNGYRGHVFTASNALANRVSKLKWRLIAVRVNDGTETEVASHLLLDALRKPNPYQSGRRVLHSMSVKLDLAGDDYWFKIRNADGEPEGFWPLAPYLVQPIWKAPEGLIGWRYNIGAGSEPLDIPRSEIVHFAEPNPDDPILGYARARAGSREINADLAMKDFRDVWFRNEARPDYVVVTEIPPGFDQDDALEEIEARIRIHHQGVRNWGKPMVLPSGTDVKTLTQSMRDMQFDELTASSRDEVFEMLGYHRSRAGYTDGLNRANADAQDYVWASDTLEPRAELIADALTHQLAEVDYQGNRANGIRLEVRPPKDLVPRDREFELAKTRAYVDMGVVTRNELREEEGRDPIEGGDVPLVAMGLAPLAEVAQGAAAYSPAPMPEPAPMDSAPAPVAETQPTKPAPRIHARILLASDEARAAYWHRAAPRLDTSERIFLRVITPLFHKQRDRVLANARRVVGRSLDRYAGWHPRKVRADLRIRMARAPMDDNLLDGVWGVREENIAISTGMRPPIRTALQTGGKMGGEQVQISWDVSDPRAVKYLRDHALAAADDINTTTRKQLAKILSTGVEQGLSIDEIVTSMGDAFDDIDRYRRYTIAQTETTAATNHGQLLAWTDPEVGGMVDRKQWVSSRDDRVRDSHVLLDGEIVGINEDFKPGLSAPGDPSADPSETIRCRCVMAPVFAGD